MKIVVQFTQKFPIICEYVHHDMTSMSSFVINIVLCFTRGGREGKGKEEEIYEL